MKSLLAFTFVFISLAGAQEPKLAPVVEAIPFEPENIQRQTTTLPEELEYIEGLSKVELEQKDYEKVAQELEQKAESSDNPDEKRMLKKLGGWVKESSKSPAIKRFGMKMGKASSFISTEFLRPWVASMSFLRGYFTKGGTPEANIKEAAFKFYLDNEPQLTELYKDPRVNGFISEGYIEGVTRIMQNNALAALKGTLIDINFNPSSMIHSEGQVVEKTLLEAKNIQEFIQVLDNLSLERNRAEIASVKFERLTEETIKQNLEAANLGAVAPLIDFTPFVNELKASLGFANRSIQRTRSFDDVMFNESIKRDFEAYLTEFTDLHEGRVWENRHITLELAELVSALVAESFIPSTVFNLLIDGAGTVYSAISTAASIGTYISLGVCYAKREARLKDEDFRRFCNYVTIRNAQKLVRSKASGFMAGRNLRRRGFKKSAKHAGTALKEATLSIWERIDEEIENVKAERRYMKECGEEGKSKQECRGELKELEVM